MFPSRVEGASSRLSSSWPWAAVRASTMRAASCEITCPVRGNLPRQRLLGRRYQIAKQRQILLLHHQGIQPAEQSTPAVGHSRGLSRPIQPPTPAGPPCCRRFGQSTLRRSLSPARRRLGRFISRGVPVFVPGRTALSPFTAIFASGKGTSRVGGAWPAYRAAWAAAPAQGTARQRGPRFQPGPRRCGDADFWSWNNCLPSPLWERGRG